MNKMEYPVVYRQLKLLIKIWEKSKADDKDIVIQMMKDSMKQIERNMIDEIQD